MFERELAATAAAMVAPGKGILAIDESSGTIKKRFDTIGVESTVENRRAYRDLLITPGGLSQYISGMILYDETLRQATKDGTPFAAVMQKNGILPGIKVDTGAKDLAGAPGEQVTEGLDGLRERLAEYKKLGAKFAKWRAVINIGADYPERLLPFPPMRMRSRVTRRCARKPASCRSWSRRSSWTARIPSSAVST